MQNEDSSESWLRRLCTIVAILAGLALRCGAVNVDALPKPTGYVSDLAHVLDGRSKQDLEAFCTQVEQQLGVQFALVTIDTIDDQPIRDLALEIARRWGVGDRKSNQGVLLLLAIKDHKSDIETGRGIEPYLTDGFAGSTLRSIRPELRAGNYGSALKTAAREMATQVAQGKGRAFNAQMPEPQRQPRSAPDDGAIGIPVPVVIIGIIILLFLFGRGGRRGGGNGFLTGMILGNLLSGGRRSRGSGNDWGSGGGFGGNSGGGGGFGGFGGGDFGGGGASSNW